MTAGILAGVFAAVGVMRASSRAPAAPAPSAASLLELYDQREYEAVANQLKALEDVRALDRLDADLKDHAKGWIESVPQPLRRRRAFVAGAVALELWQALVAQRTWANDRFNDRADNPEALPQVRKLIRALSAETAPDPIELNYVLAEIAAWQRWSVKVRLTAGDEMITAEPGWAVLLGKPALFQLSKTQLAVGKDGVLGQALARFPDDPRLALARAEGIESIETRCPSRYCVDELFGEVADDVRRRADSDGSERFRDFAARNLKTVERFLPVAAEFAKVADAHPEVRAEAQVHMGYLAIRASRPDAALGPLERARESDDAYVRYLAEYLTARALDALKRPVEAAAAARRALAVVPNAPSAAALLAVTVFDTGSGADREEAHRLLEAANARSPETVDPWEWYWQGDARLWLTYMDRLRQDLRR
jgi:tetratricopeptide (TPR) repeat protein